jgi:hypothetical protein
VKRLAAVLVIVVALLTVGCGSAGAETAKPERWLRAHWPSTTLTLAKVYAAIGAPDSIRRDSLKDVYGKRYTVYIHTWKAGHGSAIMTGRGGAVTVVIPNVQSGR